MHLMYLMTFSNCMWNVVFIPLHCVATLYSIQFVMH